MDGLRRGLFDLPDHGFQKPLLFLGAAGQLSEGPANPISVERGCKAAQMLFVGLCPGHLEDKPDGGVLFHYASTPLIQNIPAACEKTLFFLLGVAKRGGRCYNKLPKNRNTQGACSFQIYTELSYELLFL